MTLLAPRNTAFDKNHIDDKDKDRPVKDDPLREDIRLLGRMLGDTLREQEGEPTFDRSKISVKRRSGSGASRIPRRGKNSI
jgi:hypothetical protein